MYGLNGPIAAEYGSAAEALMALQPLNEVQWATVSGLYTIPHMVAAHHHGMYTKSYTKVYIMKVIRRCYG